MNLKNFNRACERLPQKLANKNHTLVKKFLDVTAPQRLPANVLSSMVVYDYPLEHVMARFTPPDCATALATAVHNNKIEACAFLIDFVSDSLKLTSLALRAAEKGHTKILEILSEELSEKEKIWVVRHVCIQANKYSRTVGAQMCTATAEVLFKNCDTPQLLKLIEEASPGSNWLSACEHVLAVNQKRVLESVIPSSTPTTKRKI